MMITNRSNLQRHFSRHSIQIIIFGACGIDRTIGKHYASVMQCNIRLTLISPKVPTGLAVAGLTGFFHPYLLSTVPSRCS